MELRKFIVDLVNEVWFIIVTIAIVTSLGLFLFYCVKPFDLVIATGECETLQNTGHYCILCGGTRATKQLLDLSLLESVQYSIIPVGILIIAVSYFFVFLVKKRKAYSIAMSRCDLVFAVISLTVTQCIYKNYDNNFLVLLIVIASVSNSLFFLTSSLLLAFADKMRNPFRALYVLSNGLVVYLFIERVGYVDDYFTGLVNWLIVTTVLYLVLINLYRLGGYLDGKVDCEV